MIRTTSRLLPLLVATCFVAGPGRAHVVLDMPRPRHTVAPKSDILHPEKPAPAAGELGGQALMRYAHGRRAPRSSIDRWGYRSRRGHGLPPAYAHDDPFWGWGGYRISLSPWSYGGVRAWNGGYVHPWLYY